MERKRVICLFLFVVLILIFSSCHPRHVSDVKLAMTKEEVSLCGDERTLSLIRPLMGQLLKHGYTILLAMILSVRSLLLEIE